MNTPLDTDRLIERIHDEHRRQREGLQHLEPDLQAMHRDLDQWIAQRRRSATARRWAAAAMGAAIVVAAGLWVALPSLRQQPTQLAQHQVRVHCNQGCDANQVLQLTRTLYTAI